MNTDKSNFLKLLTICSTLSGCYLPINETQKDNACRYLYENPYISHSIESISQDTRMQALILAIIEHESSNKANARPVKTWLIKPYIPWEYYSSAKGYAQSTKPTWIDFNNTQKNHTTQRHSYYNNVAFINWYMTTKGTLLLDQNYFYEAYFLYHDGCKGYHRNIFKRSINMKNYALKVANTAKKNQQDLETCKKHITWQTQWDAT